MVWGLRVFVEPNGQIAVSVRTRRLARQKVSRVAPMVSEREQSLVLARVEHLQRLNALVVE